MKTLVIVVFLILAVTFTLHAATGDGRHGVWTADLTGDQLHLTVFRGDDQSRHASGMMGFELSLTELGLAKSTVESNAANVTFSLARPAGTVAFDGRFASGDGAGQYRFTPNPSYERELNKLGYDDITDNQMLLFAVENLQLDNVRGLIALDRKPQRRQLDEVAVFHITPQLLRDFDALGFGVLPIREAVNMRVGHVDANFVREIRALGFTDISPRDVANLGILGATPAYIRSLRDAGLRDITPRQATDLRVGNVTPRYIDELRRAGYGDLSARQLAEFGIQHVTVEYINQLRAAGYDHLTPRQLIEMRVMNVTPEYIRSMTK